MACQAVGRIPTSVAMPVWMIVRTPWSRSRYSSGVPMKASTRYLSMITSPALGLSSSTV